MSNQQPWLSQYPEYMPKQIEAIQYDSLTALCQDIFQKHAMQSAFENIDTVLSYADLDKLSTHFATFLQQTCGLKSGDRIVIQLPNIFQFPVAMLGAMKAGLILVNTNPLYTPREMQHQFKDSGAVAIIILANFAHHLEKIIDQTPIQTVIITEIGDLLGGFKKWLTNFIVKKIKKMVPHYYLPQAVSFSSALLIGSKQKLTKITTKIDDTFCLQYTGGTTGLSKGAELTHRNILSNIFQVAPILKESSRGSLTIGDVAIIPLPLYHIFALTACFVFLHNGLLNRIITNPRDLNGFIKTLKKRFHTIIGVNTLYNAILNHPRFPTINFSETKSCIAGGMALQEIVFKKWLDKTGIQITEGYGLTETSPVLTFQIPGKERMGSIGVPIPSTEIQIMDDDGKVMAMGESGELCARGPQVFKGYWQKDNTNVFHDGGWFKTGDVAVMDTDGYFKIIDRKKDMILVSGFNVYPNEIEGVIATHPKVLEVAAVGVKDEQCGEVVKIIVVKKDQSLTDQELYEYCKQNLTGYKRPKFIEFRTEIPKTNVGKILRRALREESVG